MPYTLKGRRILVTGGSRGLGAVICEKFAVEGAHIIVNYVTNKDRAIEVVKKVETYGVKAFMVQGVWGLFAHLVILLSWLTLLTFTGCRNSRR
jgi:NAD(P)-dependent dehydrogenase (short-subunit alcohol dehydrogenase family)